jgi:hypothetical protein
MESEEEVKSKNNIKIAINYEENTDLSMRSSFINNNWLYITKSVRKAHEG